MGDTTFSNGSLVHHKMVHDLFKSVRPWLEVVLDNYRVLYYSGQLDIIVPYLSSERMFNALQFRGVNQYQDAMRVPWYVDGELAGYVKSAGNFTEVLVRNAGHMVPADQPRWALDLISRFIQGKLLK